LIIRVPTGTLVVELDHHHRVDAEVEDGVVGGAADPGKEGFIEARAG
jgi:hypothetical protein